MNGAVPTFYNTATPELRAALDRLLARIRVVQPGDRAEAVRLLRFLTDVVRMGVRYKLPPDMLCDVIAQEIDA